jgi:hypothetical protein
VHLLHLATLWSLAVAQPLLDVLGRNAEFFAIRRSQPEDIVLFAIGLVVLPPLVLFALEAAAEFADARAGRAVHLVLVGGLSGLIALLFLKRSGASSAVLLPLCAALGAAAALLYARAEVARSFLTVLAPAPLVVALVFLFTTPVHRLLSPDEAKAELAPDGGRAPVVLLILDEFPVTSLLRSDGRIDARRYPNFAALARDSMWFRNTSSVDAATEVAVPAILTGVRPHSGALPTAADHPHNVFTLFGRGRPIHVHESVSDLCPERLCPAADDGPSFGARMRSLVSDLEIVGLHVLLPNDVRRRLPSIDQRWQNFRGDSDDGDASAQADAGSTFTGIIARKRSTDDRPGIFERFVAGIPRPRPGAPGPLNVLHALLPHVPWEHFPDGTRYSNSQEIPGLDFEKWSPDPGAAETGFQRHLLEVGYVDRLLGALLRKLRASGSYDDTLLVVTADHGVSLRAGHSRRAIDAATAQDILPVPLFVKPPGRPHRRVVDTHLQTIDIVPTMADLLHVRVPWRMDGVSAFSPEADRRTVRATNAGEKPFEIATARLDALRSAALRRQIALLGEGGPPRLRDADARRVVGRPVPRGVAAAGGASATVDDPAAFAAVDLEGPALPLHVSGQVRGDDVGKVAVALNGRIGAVARVFRDEDGRRFSAMLPRSLVRQGDNAVEVLGLSRRDGALQLTRLGRVGGRQSPYVLADGGIVGPRGRRWRIGRGLAGAVDNSVNDAGVVHVSGWAAQTRGWGPVEQVVGFGGRRLLFSGPPSRDRAEVGALHKVPGTDLGWRFDLPAQSAAGRPRIFALGAGLAFELPWVCGAGARQDIGC